MNRRARLALIGGVVVVALGAAGSAPHRASGAAAAGGDSAAAPRRVALIIGIADYQFFALGGPPGASDLRGPHTDVARMRASLVNYGFGDSADVRVLLDGQASRAGIREAFAWLHGRVRDSNDVAFVYFSGHGTQVPDLDRDEARATADDKTDEALVAYDTRDNRDPAQVVLDDQIGAWLDGLRTRRIHVVIDACFSGTITRDMGAAIPRGPMGIKLAPRDSAQDELEAMRLTAIDTPYPILTAATAEQTALELPFAELGGRYAGVLTYSLTRLLDAAVGSGATYEDLLPILRRDMRQWSGQTATLDGSRGARATRLLQAGDLMPRRPFVSVTASGDRFRVHAGAASGMRRGTVLEVFPPDDRSLEGRPLATLIVDSVGESSAVASIKGVGGGGGAVPNGARAVVSRMPPDLQALTKLAVYVSPAARGVSDIVRRIPFVEITDSARSAVQLFAAGNGIQVSIGGDRLVPLGAAPGVTAGVARWASDTVVANGSTAFAATAEAMCVALRRAFVARSLAMVKNPTRNLRLAIDVRLVKSGTHPDTLSASTVDTLVEGQLYDVVVDARSAGASNAPRFISVAVAGHRGVPLVLWPAGGRDPNPAYPLVNRGPQVILAKAAAAAPFGPDRIVAYFGAFPYSFVQLVASAPGCSPDLTTRDVSDEDPSVTGWTSVERRIVVVPKPAGP